MNQQLSEQKLLGEYERMINRMVWHYRNSSAELSDLKQAAYEGMLSALKTLKKRQNAEDIIEGAYIRTSIKRALLKELDKQKGFALPSYIREKIRAYYGVRNKLKAINGNEPTDDEIQSELEFTNDEMKRIVDTIELSAGSIDLLSNEMGDKSRFLSCSEEGYESVENDEFRKQLWNNVHNRLNNEQNQIIEMYFRKNYTIVKIAEKLGISSETVRRRISTAMHSLLCDRGMRELARTYGILHK